MPFFDISIPLRVELAVWPGDTPVSVKQIASLAAGDTVNLGALTSSLHAGTHADAVLHVDVSGRSIEVVDPQVFVGTAQVCDVSGRDVIRTEHLSQFPLGSASRLLLKTGGWTDHTRFPERIPVIAPDVPALLASHGIKLLGVDVPSVDPIDSKDLPNHHALATYGIQILESLDLSAVEPGLYHLSALPLRIVGADAAPVRAVLWR